LLYIGNDPQLTLTSSAQSGFLSFAPLKLSWQIVIGLVTAAAISLIAIWSFLGWLWRLPRRVKSGVGLRRRNQALDAMEDALIAGAEGDTAKARKKSERARALIGSEDLGRMVSALNMRAVLMARIKMRVGPLIFYLALKLQIINGGKRLKLWAWAKNASILIRTWPAAAVLCC